MRNGVGLTRRLDEIARAEFQTAVRALLRRPLLVAEGAAADRFALVRKHREKLAEWFLAEAGYRLVVEADFARLGKVVRPGSRQPRGLGTRSGRPFDRQEYAVFCLVLAALEAAGAQTTLATLAEEVRLRAGEIPGIRIDFTNLGDRWAFVHAVRALADFSVLSFLDGDEERYAREGEGGDALYVVHHRRLARLLASPVPPSAIDRPEAMLAEEYPATTEGAARRARHAVTRELLEEAVLHLEELSEDEAAYLSGQRHRFELRLGADAGFEIEVRREGLAAIDPSGEATDLEFPGVGTVAHFALLLAERVLDGGISPPVTGEAAAALVEELAPKYGAYWSARFTSTPEGRAELAREAIGRLEAFRLLEEGRPRPALARFACLGSAEEECPA